MLRFMLVISLFLCSFAKGAGVESVAVASHATSGMHLTQEVISLARQCRINFSLSPEEEQKRVKNLLEHISDILPHYKVQNKLKNTIKQFVDDVLSIEIGAVSKFTLVDTRTTEFFGKSHDIVYLVQDQKGEVRYIVKAFQYPCQPGGKFIPEISAIDLIKNMRLPNVVPVEPLAFAICHDGNEEWGLLLESTAPGKRLDQYMLVLAKQGNGTIERGQYLELAKFAFKRMGETIGLLHSIKPTPSLPLHALILAKYEDKVSRVLKDSFIINTLSKHFSTAQFIQYVENIKTQAMQVPLFHTYAHGDTNLGNVFYDHDKDTISFIDLQGMHQSVDITGQPISDAVIDLVRTQDSLRRKAAACLTENEIETLITSFYLGYKSVTPLPDKVHFHFYETYIKIGKLILGSHYIDEIDPMRSEFEKVAFEEGVEYFKNHVHRSLQQNHEAARQKTINFAKQYRIDLTNSSKTEKEREQALVEKACDSLVVYQTETLEAGVSNFLKEIFFNQQFQIVNSRTTELFGKSGGEVFFIKDPQGALCYIVKAFPEPRTLLSHFLPEISAIDMMEKLKLQHVVPIEQCAFAICREGNREWGLLLETVAHGERLDQYLHNVSIESKDSSKRQEHLAIAEKAFTRVGTSMAYLHSTRASAPSSVPKAILTKCENKLAQVLKNPFVIKKLSNFVDVDSFVNYINEVKSKAQAINLYCNYIHGDANLGNIFYDALEDCSYFIDLGGMHRSMDIAGQPISHATMDLVQFEDSLSFYSTRLTEQEMQSLRHAFYQSYRDAGAEIPDGHLWDFYEMYVKLRRLVTKSDYRKETDPKVQAHDKFVFNDAIQYFQKRCSNKPRQALKIFNGLVVTSIIKALS